VIGPGYEYRMWFLALLTIVLSLVALGLSMVPGVLEQFLVWPVYFLAGLYALLAVGLSLRAVVRGPNPGRGHAIIVLANLVLTPYLVETRAVQALVFQRKQPEFEALVPQAPPPGRNAPVILAADFGLFIVDRWGTDDRGGVYFRSVQTAHTSYGYAYRPNALGSPFGDAGYELHPLDGDWFAFAAREGP
jgi:hypothetical protein